MTIQTCPKGHRYAGDGCGLCHLEQLHAEHERRVEEARRRVEGVIPAPAPVQRHAPALSAL